MHVVVDLSRVCFTVNSLVLCNIELPQKNIIMSH